MKERPDLYVWSEKYRPKTIDEAILPSSMKKLFMSYVENGDIPSMTLAGSPGSGKTTAILALARQLKYDFLFINASEENGVDTLRTKVMDFAGTVSLTDSKKVVILDEADNLTHGSQTALRGIIEQYAQNCVFVLTCNYKNKILPALHSRCPVVDYKIPNAEKKQLAMEFMGRLEWILKKESIEYDKAVLAELIKKHFPDFRRVLNELYRHRTLGRIDKSILENIGEINMENLLKCMQSKDVQKIRKWVVENQDNDPQHIYRVIWEFAMKHVKEANRAESLVLIHDYCYKGAFVVDQELNITTCLLHVLATTEIE